MTVETFFRYAFGSIFLGIIFCATVARMAINDNNEDPPEQHPKLHTAGWFMVAFATICLMVFIIGMSQIDYPDEDPRWRPASFTPEQNKTITGLHCFFLYLSIALYCLLFKRSRHKWGVWVILQDFFE